MPTPRAKIFAAKPHIAVAAPAQFAPAVIPTPAEMSFWGNDVHGDCCTAEEAAAIQINSQYYAASQGVSIPSAVVVQWASAHGYLEGANIVSVIESMEKDGMSYGGAKYTDGAYQSVDFTDWTTLTSAISQGPVKIGVASSQFDAVPGIGQRNGWLMVGLKPDPNEDHCTGLCGYGTVSFLCSRLGVAVPAGVDGSANAVLMFTWDSIGIVDYKSLLNVIAEAWLRTPTTIRTPPAPTPTPPPGPSPSPAPSPSPTPTPAVTQGTPPPGQPPRLSYVIDVIPAPAAVAFARYGAGYWQPSLDGKWYTSADLGALLDWVAKHDAALHPSEVKGLPAHPVIPAPGQPAVPPKSPPAAPTYTVTGTISINGGAPMPLAIGAPK